MKNTSVINQLSVNAQKFISDLYKKKKAQIEKGNYVISVYFETLQGQDDSTGNSFDFTEAVVRGMVKRKSSYSTDISKRFDYEGKKFKDNDHIILYGIGVKAEKKKGWTDPKLIAEELKEMSIKQLIAEMAMNILKERVELDEKLASHIIRGDTYIGVPDRIVAQAKDKVNKMKPSTASEHSKAMQKALSDMGWELTISGKYVREEVDLDEDVHNDLSKAQSRYDKTLKNLKDAEDFVNGNRGSVGGKGSNYSTIGNMTASQKSKYLSPYLDAHAKSKSLLNKAKKAAGISEETDLDEVYQETANYLVSEGIELESLNEEQLDELIGAIARGIGRGLKRTVVNKKGNFRFSTAGRADAAQRTADATKRKSDNIERLRKQRERLQKERERLQRIRQARNT